jgi:hypothetical protein
LNAARLLKGSRSVFDFDVYIIDRIKNDFDFGNHFEVVNSRLKHAFEGSDFIIRLNNQTRFEYIIADNHFTGHFAS